MKKTIKIAVFLLLVASAVYLLDVWKDKKALQQSLIRLHVVANSDSAEDQSIKLQVKDEIVRYLQPRIEQCSDKEQAMDYIRDNLITLQKVANDVLITAGQDAKAGVTLGKELYGTRVYDTFSLPAGSYDSLRITIGDGEGKNWWCVVFPSLCFRATAADFQDAAVSAGLSEQQGDTLRGGFRFRFFILDCLGKIEKLFN